MIAGTVRSNITRLCVSFLPADFIPQAVSTPQQVIDGARRAPLITGQDGLLDFRSMTAQAVVQRFKGISHQVRNI